MSRVFQFYGSWRVDYRTTDTATTHSMHRVQFAEVGVLANKQQWRITRLVLTTESAVEWHQVVWSWSCNCSLRVLWRGVVLCAGPGAAREGRTRRCVPGGAQEGRGEVRAQTSEFLRASSNTHVAPLQLHVIS